MHSLQGNRTQLRPGFPIRTPSDQRFVDNSPRLNAVSHVLHRLSMPRHPPCALKQQTHTNNPTHKQNTHKQKTRCSRPLYSSHTPHPPPPTSHNDQPATSEPTRNNHPHHTHQHTHTVRAPCAAPDTQQCTNNQHFLLSHNRFMQPTHPTHASTRAVCIHLDFQQKRQQHHTRALNQQKMGLQL